MQKGISDANKHKMQGLPYMLSWLSSHNWQRPTAKGSPHMSDNFLPRSTMQQQHQQQQQQQQQQYHRQQKHHQQTMFTEILLLLPCAISALVIFVLAVFLGLHTAILSLMQSLHLRILSITGTTVINHIMQYLYSVSACVCS
jgi:cation transport ATPase